VYSKVDRSLNADARFRACSHDAQLVYLRLLTGQHVTVVPGLSAATHEGLASAWGFTPKAFAKAFAELAAHGLAAADWKAGVVWVPDAISHADPANANMVKGWAQHLKLIPDCELKRDAIRSLGAWLLSEKTSGKFQWFKGFELGPTGELQRRDGTGAEGNGIGNGSPKSSANGIGNGIGNGSGNRMPTQDQDQDQDQDQEQKQEQDSERAREAPRAEPLAPKRPLPAHLRDSFSAGSAPAARPDVQRVHEAWKLAFGRSGAVFRGPFDEDAYTISGAIDAHGEADCLLVAKHAPEDGMVSGRDDKNSVKHPSIRYIFGNEETFSRILSQVHEREAKKLAAGAPRASSRRPEERDPGYCAMPPELEAEFFAARSRAGGASVTDLIDELADAQGAAE
jgi:hypothetical protein